MAMDNGYPLFLICYIGYFVILQGKNRKAQNLMKILQKAFKRRKTALKKTSKIQNSRVVFIELNLMQFLISIISKFNFSILIILPIISLMPSNRRSIYQYLHQYLFRYIDISPTPIQGGSSKKKPIDVCNEK